MKKEKLQGKDYCQCGFFHFPPLHSALPPTPLKLYHLGSMQEFLKHILKFNVLLLLLSSTKKNFTFSRTNSLKYPVFAWITMILNLLRKRSKFIMFNLLDILKNC